MTALDSSTKRLEAKALLDGPPRGHYKLSFVERLAPRQKPFGAGRIFISELTRRDISELLEGEHGEHPLDDDWLRIEDRLAPIGKMGSRPSASIHGGGETLPFSRAMANYQPLTFTNGIRIHNADLAKLMDFLEPRLRCLQLQVLTILDHSG